MAAPIVAFVVGLLTSATLAKGPATLLALDAMASRVVAIEQQVCPAAAPAAAALAMIKSTGIVATLRARLRRDAALVCADQPQVNTPAARLVAVAKLLADIAAADGLVPAPKP
jgi:UDP-glucose 6-dehydrogenase